MVELRLGTSDRLVEAALVEGHLTAHPSPHAPSGKRNAMPGAPTALGLLGLVANLCRLVHIDEDNIRIVANSNPSFIDKIPNASRRIAHPTDNLLEFNTTLIHLIEHQRERIFYRWNPRG